MHCCATRDFARRNLCQQQVFVFPFRAQTLVDQALSKAHVGVAGQGRDVAMRLVLARKIFARLR